METFKSAEPYFIIISTQIEFTIICTTLDFDEESEKPVPLNSDYVVINKQNYRIKQF